MAFLPLIFQIIRPTSWPQCFFFLLNVLSLPKRLYKAELFHKCLLAGCKWFLFTIDRINEGKMATESFFSPYPP